MDFWHFLFLVGRDVNRNSNITYPYLYMLMIDQGWDWGWKIDHYIDFSLQYNQIVDTHNQDLTDESQYSILKW